MRIKRNLLTSLLLAAASLALSANLSVRTLGGVIEIPPAPAPDPSETIGEPASNAATADGQSDGDDPADPVTEAALALVQTMLSLL